jgi:secondary thiamine-phosphate synthase enzyme
VKSDVQIASATVDIRTPARTAVVNVTAEARRALAGSGIRRGLALLTVPHTTCGLCVNEDEQGLRHDLELMTSTLVDLVKPAGGFQHDRVDNNARAHLMAALLGHSVTIAVRDSELSLGTWQSLLLVEIDGPRQRRLDMVFLGD